MAEQIWNIYAPDVDIQMVFENAVLESSWVRLLKKFLKYNFEIFVYFL